MLVVEWCELCKHPDRIVRREWARTHNATITQVPHVSECAHCGAQVMWVRTENGKAMPIDADAGGPPGKARFRKERIERVEGRIIGIVHFMRDSEMEANTAPLYCCHFDTCIGEAS
jgi:hypothetical protein